VNPLYRRIFSGVAAVAALAGCTPASPAEPPTPEPTTTSSTATTEASRPTEPPPVTAPIDISQAARHVCALLTEQEQLDLGLRRPPWQDLSPAEGTSDLLGTCTWSDPPGEHAGESYGYGIRLHTTDDPLAQAYRESGKGAPDYTWTVFTPRTIRGLPAVVRSIGGLDSSCHITIGTGNGQGIEIIGSQRTPDLYERMVAVAERVVDAVRG
jgi:hypothetical protein